ncbi:replication-relaxation family protein [Antrihabitans spumae]|uniref:Replication-relaxation family protein n=1 Tax=Antrihabitans spumae TaxID=3373370 RepID=A0ABW7KBG1_9NOCA
MADRLSDRDWAILRSVQQHQLMTVDQIHALHFADLAPKSGPRIARRTLARLRAMAVLGTLHRRIGGVRAGSNGLVHFVDDVGNRLLAQESGTTIRRRKHEPTERFMDHRLAIGSTHVELAAAARSSALDLLRCDLEPPAWRRYVGLGGARLVLKPDLYVETAASGSELVDAWFVEIDLGTESIPTVLKKCREYETYRRTGTEQERNDGAFPIVIWSMTARDLALAERRRTALRKGIAADRTLTDALFRIVAPDQLLPLIQKGGDT